MRIALIGTRGPGSYGGFETAVAEIGARLADRGHAVTAYARSWCDARWWGHPGVRIVTLPSVRTKSLDTISHTTVSTAHLLLRNRPECAVFFGVGNAPLARLARARHVPVVFNVDGLDRDRAKWDGAGSRYLHRAEGWAVNACDVLVTDAVEVRDYYRDEHAAASSLIPYGAPTGPEADTGEVTAHGLEPGGYVLYVSRLEPENHPEVAIEAHRRSGVDLPLVVVGGSAYDADYEASLRASAHDGVRFLGFQFGASYRQLGSHAAVYLQCTEVGGTHPALVEAMGFGNAIIALDNAPHREVLGDAGRYYGDVDDLAATLRELVDDPAARSELTAAARARAAERYDWDAVTDAYVEACEQAREAAWARR